MSFKETAIAEAKKRLSEVLGGSLATGKPTRGFYHCAIGLCSALEYIHSKKVTHFDVKPGNAKKGNRVYSVVLESHV